ncbi:MAG: type II toxin-antitoxin system Phd/YefM family antitoxin [bacterium]
MTIFTYTDARKNFKTLMEKVCDDHTPITITRNGERPVVVLSLEDYRAIEETLYLMRSPKNAERLVRAAKDLEEGKNYQTQELIEE